MRIHELVGMPVMALDTGSRLGIIKGVELQMSEARVYYVRVDRPGRKDDGIIPWAALHAVGQDAVTVSGADAVFDAIPAADRDNLTPHLSDRPVMTQNGTRLGHLDDYDLDPATGRIESFHVAPQGMLNRLTGRGCTFPRSVLVTIGGDAIIVSDEILSAEAA
ncbi:MAG: PRC-barrel domain-containing protein [Actinomycetota bacterium]